MNVIQNIAKNTAFLIISQIIGSILAFFYTIYAARYLGADGFGILSFALAFTAIFSVFTDLGLNMITVRDSSRDKTLLNKYVNNILFIKLILVLIVLGSIVVIINLLNYPPNTINVVYIIALYIGFTSFIGFFNSIFQVYERFEYQSIGNILSNGIIFIGTLVAMYYGLQVVQLAFAYLISAIIVFLYSYFICRFKFIIPKLDIDYSFWKSKIKEALPFGMIGIFISIYFRIDIIMLSLLQTNVVVGYYSAAYKLLDLLTTLIIVTTAQVLFPVISRHFKSDKLTDIFALLFKITLYSSIFITLLVFLFSKDLILLIYGYQYTNSIIVLQILIFAFLAMSISSASSILLNSVHRQNIVALGTGICVVLNVALNLILIPIYSLNGAAFATFLTEVLGFSIYFYSVVKFLNLGRKDMFKILIITRDDIRYIIQMLFPHRFKQDD